MIQLDHLVIAAQTLEAGVTYVQDILNIELKHGGRHLHQGTHNKVLRLNDCYLEVIAPDPDSSITPPWFGLGHPEILESLQTPHLLTWVAQSDDINTLITKVNYPVTVQTAQRDHLRWQFSFTKGGNLLSDGLLPYLIQWESEPAFYALPESGYSLLRLEGSHPQAEQLNSVLVKLGLQDALSIKSGDIRLKAILRTSRGREVII
jgi:hypothetical protein